MILHKIKREALLTDDVGRAFFLWLVAFDFIQQIEDFRMFVEVVLPVILVCGHQIGVKCLCPRVFAGKAYLHGVGYGTLHTGVGQAEQSLFHIGIGCLAAGNTYDGGAHLPQIECIVESGAEGAVVCNYVDMFRGIDRFALLFPQFIFHAAHAAVDEVCAPSLYAGGVGLVFILVCTEGVVSESIVCASPSVEILQGGFYFLHVEGRDEPVEFHVYIRFQVTVAEQLVERGQGDRSPAAAVVAQVDDKVLGVFLLHFLQHTVEYFGKRRKLPDGLQGVGRHLLLQDIPIVKFYLPVQVLPALLMHVFKVVACHDAVDIDEHHLFLVVHKPILQLLVCVCGPTAVALQICASRLLAGQQGQGYSSRLSIGGEEGELNAVAHVGEQLFQEMFGRDVSA